MDRKSAGHRRIRWWPLPVLAVLATAGITASRVALEADRKAANTVSVGIGLLAIIGSGVACALILFAGSFRTRGFTGDMMPIFEWRWGSAVGMGSPTPAPTDLPPVDDPVPGLVDFPQFLGPDRNSILAGPDLARDWDKNPLHELWRRSLGAAWSGFAVAGRRAITQEQHGDDEVVACYDTLSGNLLSGAFLWGGGSERVHWSSQVLASLTAG